MNLDTHDRTDNTDSARRTRRMTRRRKRVIVPVVLLVLLGVSLAVYETRADAPKASTPTSRPSSVAPSASGPTTEPVTKAFDKSRYSTTDPSSLWVVVNKTHPLSPVDYAPSDIVTLYGKPVSAKMTADLKALMTDSATARVALTLVSGYRSYVYQQNLYGSYVATDGQDKADTYSARAGFSEHQTGLAVDFGNTAGTCTVEDCYADTPEGRWLAANAYKYGFLLRYTAADQAETGYQAEAWHYRYIGRELAAQLHDQGVSTLEGFFGITGGTSYDQ